MALYSFLGVRGIGTNGARVREFKKFRRFFNNEDMDGLSSSLAVGKKSSNFAHTLM